MFKLLQHVHPFVIQHYKGSTSSNKITVFDSYKSNYTVFVDGSFHFARRKNNASEI